MTAGEWKRLAAGRLCAFGQADAETDPSLFLCAILGLELSKLRFNLGVELTNKQLETLNQMLSRREKGEPEQYIEGYAYFMGLKFICDRRALIPRQDSESVLEAALEEIKNISKPEIFDLCTGSGCLAVALSSYRRDAKVSACDISAEAVELARENARLNGVRVDVRQSDGMTAFQDERFDLIICNPPYLTREDMNELQTEVCYEPPIALYGGEDGLDFYRRFSNEIKPRLKANGKAVFEVGQGQANSVIEIFKAAFATAEIFAKKDLNGVERAVIVRT